MGYISFDNRQKSLYSSEGIKTTRKNKAGHYSKKKIQELVWKELNFSESTNFIDLILTVGLHQLLLFSCSLSVACESR